MAYSQSIGSAIHTWIYSIPQTKGKECMVDNLSIIAVDAEGQTRALTPIKTCNHFLNWIINTDSFAANEGVLTITYNWQFDGNALFNDN